MSASAKRFYSLLGGLALLIGTIFVYYSLIVPEYNSVQALRGEAEGESATLNEYKTISNSISGLLSQYHSLASIETSLNSILPTSNEEVPTIVNQIQGLAATDGLSLSSLSVQDLPIDYGHERPSINPLGTVRVTLNLTGSYPNFKNFLNDLSNNARIFDLDSLSVSPLSATAKNPVFNYTVSVDAYYESTSVSGR